MIREEARRAGDPAYLVAKADRVRSELGWAPRYDDLQKIVTTWADLGHIILTQAGTQNNPVVVDTTESRRTPELQPLVRARLDVVPEYLIVADSTRALYLSAAVRNLAATDDLDALLRTAMLLTEDNRVATVQLSISSWSSRASSMARRGRCAGWSPPARCPPRSS